MPEEFNSKDATQTHASSSANSAGEASDADARREAVLGRGSYIVQAPAGSGKTELLVQRFLRLLGEVKAPESIVAITFTRKAASEMRNRIVDAMQAAATTPEPSEPHLQMTWALARKALAQDRRQGWGLARAPRRLRVQTIDSLCSELVRQLPLLTDMGTLTDVLEDAGEAFRSAAEATLDIDSDYAGDNVATLVGHLDGNMERAAQMLASMLGRRDQWLAHLGSRSEPSRKVLESALATLVDDEIRRACAAIPTPLLADMATTASTSANFLSESDALPAVLEPFLSGAVLSPADAKIWPGLAALFLTAKGEARKTLNKNQGVPTAKAVEPHARERLEQHRQAAKDILERLTNLPGAVAALARAASLPQPAYSDPEWQVLLALVRLMRLAALHLQVGFSDSGQTDFSEVQTRAIAGLGHPEAPSELALALDYRLEHLLVDEFQDTSNAQVELLSKLCAEWEPDSGRSLFIVGDPMQSIYRFRLAEVGNFLKVASNGIDHIALTPLRLSANFRSASGVVNWVNDAFAQIFPARDDAALGQIRYARSVAARAPGELPPVLVHAALAANRTDTHQHEAEALVGAVRASLQGQPQLSIAILVRSRGHLSAILPMLESSGIDVEAVELDALKSRPIVNDLHALVRTVLSPHDKVAWLSVMRAPWAGLTLADLHVILAHADLRWLAIVSAEQQAPEGLSPDGRLRLQNIQRAYALAIAQFRRLPLSVVIENYWLAIGGPQCLSAYGDRSGTLELADARAYLRHLAAAERAATVLDLDGFERRLAKLYAPPDTRAVQQVQVMTIHRSKGLEFDVVMLPGLSRRPRPADKPLLAWQERTSAERNLQLVMAPVSTHGNDSGLFELIRSADAALADEESARLLYVAATRAREQLHLFGTVSWDEKSARPTVPSPSSLLGKLWPAVASDFAHLQAPPESQDEHEVTLELPALRRVISAALPAITTNFVGTAAQQDSTSPRDPAVSAVGSHASSNEPQGELSLDFDWAGDTARHTGTLVHRWLERIAIDGVDSWNDDALVRVSRSFPAALTNLGVLPEALDEACERVHAALHNALNDDIGRWLLAPHRADEAEFALTSTVHAASSGDATGFVVDRTFIDQDDVRWIVDYKTGSHEGGDIDSFLENEQARYQAQLEGYARLLGAIESRPTKLALYFPLLKALRAWDAPALD